MIKSHTNYFVITLVAVSFVWAGWHLYEYFFDTRLAVLTIEGIEENGYYAGDVPCVMRGYHPYKVSHLSVWLDGRPFVQSFRVNKRSCEYTYPMCTTKLSNGPHIMRVELVDGTRLHQTVSLERLFFVDNTNLQASFVRAHTEGEKIFQGRTLHVQFQTSTPIKEATASFINAVYNCFPESAHSTLYECFIPIACEEAPNEYMLTINATDFLGTTVQLERKVQIIGYPFKKQSLSVRPDKMKEEPAEAHAPDELEVDLAKLTAQSPQQKLWTGLFDIPLEVTGISTEFGVVRTTQERGKYAHKAVDLLARPRSVVWATQDGIIALKSRYQHSGLTVVIDHGWGVLSLYYHLDSVTDKPVGERVRKGSPIGTVGMTGYASGYHLHWELRVNNIPVDPLQWTVTGF